MNTRIKSVTSCEAAGQATDEFTFVYTVGNQDVTRIVPFSMDGGLGPAMWLRVYRKRSAAEEVWKELNGAFVSDVEFFPTPEKPA